VFLAYYLSTDAFPGATPLEYAFIAGLSVSQSLLLSPLVTTITRIYSTRTTLAIGVVLQTAALIGASFATKIWHLFLSQGLCFGWGMGFLIVGSAGILPQWFSTRRSLAQGIAAAGVGVGGLIWNLATNAMIQQIGLAWAWRILAVISCAVNVVCTLLLRDRNKYILPSQNAFDVRLLRRTGYLLVLGWGFFSEMGYVVLWFSMPAYATSVGLSAKQGSIVGALLNLGTVFGRPLIGHLSDTMGRINIATITTAWCGIICLLIWIFAKGFALLCVFAILAGMVCGTFWSTVGPVGAEVVGLRELPSALSVLFILMVPPATCKLSRANQR
jgi:MFS family permease